MNIEEEAAVAAMSPRALGSRRANNNSQTLAQVIVGGLVKPAHSLEWEAISAAARVVFTRDGRPIRTINTGRRRIVTGYYSSRKAGRAQPHEGMNEQTFFKHCEVDTRVIDYRAQLCRFEFVLDGAKRIYIADCVRLLDGDQIEVVEVKSDQRALRDPDYAAKLQAVDELCADIGWRFRVVTREQMLERGQVHKNIDDVQSWRRTHFNEADVYSVLDAISRHGGVATFGQLTRELGERRRAAATLKAMMVCRHVDIELSAPFTPDTPVRSVINTAEKAVVRVLP